MKCTVRDVVENPALGTRLVAGERGLDRELTWAHSIEVAHPWEWMGSGELLMTTGQNFPAEASEQIGFISNLDANGISGLALAERMAAEVTPEAAAVAEELGFPVLETAYEIPFVLIARAVAASNSRDVQVAKVQRVYELYRQLSVEGLSGEEMLASLGREAGARLRVLTVGSWELVMSDGDGLPAYPKELIARFPAGAPLSAVTRVTSGSDYRILLLPIGGAPRYALAAEVEDRSFDLVVLQHVAAIAGVHAEKQAAEISARLHKSERLFTQLLNGSFDDDAARAVLEEIGIGDGPWMVAAIESSAPVDPLRIHWRLHRAGVPALACGLEQYEMLLFSEAGRRDVMQLLEAEEGSTLRIGISDVIRRLGGIADGVREAAWASQAARGDGSKIMEYGVDRPLFMPGTVTEARVVVERVLGVIDDYDREHGTALLASLEVYFDENRSGVGAARRLSIHRQTLIYRLKRIEQLTGRRLDDLDDLTELHLAMRVRRRLVAEADLIAGVRAG